MSKRKNNLGQSTKRKTTVKMTRLLYKIKWTFMDLQTNQFIFKKEFKKLLSNLFYSSIVCFLIFGADAALSERLYAFPVDLDNLVNYIVGGLSVAGIFMGLYGSNTMSIYTASYTDVPGRIRKLFEEDILTNKNMNLLSNYIFFCTISIFLLLLGLEAGVVYLTWLSLYTLLTVVSYKIFGNHSQSLVDSFNLSLTPINELIKIIRLLGENKKLPFITDSETEKGFRANAEERLKDLESILRYNLESGKRISKSAETFIERLFVVYGEYTDIEGIIPFDSNWFQRRGAYSGKKWFTDELNRLILPVLEHLLKNNELSVFLDFISQVSPRLDSIDNLESYRSFAVFLDKINLLIHTYFKEGEGQIIRGREKELLRSCLTLHAQLTEKLSSLISEIDYEEIYRSFVSNRNEMPPLNTEKYRKRLLDGETEKETSALQDSLMQEIEKDVAAYILKFLESNLVPLQLLTVLAREWMENEKPQKAAFLLTQLGLQMESQENLEKSYWNLLDKVEPEGANRLASDFAKREIKREELFHEISAARRNRAAN